MTIFSPTLLTLLAAIALLLLTLHFLLLLFTPSPTPSDSSERLYTTTPSSSPSSLPSLSDPPSKRISIIVPAYNEDDRLGIMVDEAMEYFYASASRRRGGVEILVVDDGSKDGTTKTAQSLAEKWARGTDADAVEMRVVTLLRNRGKGGAVQHVSLSYRVALMAGYEPCSRRTHPLCRRRWSIEVLRFGSPAGRDAEDGRSGRSWDGDWESGASGRDRSCGQGELAPLSPPMD